ncbi:hypothetical protein [Pseudoxanthomonas mexicana]|uniref:hypothetical protein n=1 Tax=Pseudoxanthomonas mexicana TaxID=128785 RepID=UPI0007865338|nr:hypothetical protein [Pseudoxanthomonas mexicana]
MPHRRPLVASTFALLLAACSPSSGDAPSRSSDPPPDQHLKAGLERLKAEGPLPSAREASALEYWLHYKVMQATGMEEALGGEARAIAALKAFGLAVERSAVVAQTQVPRMTPAAFDGTGMDAGMMGAGYGMVGGLLTGSMLNGGLTQDQVAQAIEQGPMKFEGQDGAMGVDITQDGVNTTLEQTIKENGVTGKVKTKIHVDACPDPQGKLVVTIETESQMAAGAAQGAVKIAYRRERWLDDDARLVEGGDGSGDEFRIEMSGTGASGNNLSFTESTTTGRGGLQTGQVERQRGFTIFNPKDAEHTGKLRDAALQFMRFTAEVMLTGALGKQAPWESGRCVELKLRSTPEKRTGARPNTAYTVFAEPRAKKDGLPTGGTVKATLAFDTEKRPSYRIDFAQCPGGGRESMRACDVSKPFTVTACGGTASITHTPSSDRVGTWTFKFLGAGGFADATGTYTLSGTEESLTQHLVSNKVCGHAAGRTVCATPKPSTATWTKIEDCGE